jgi:RimJ/RimL family protein N-acetyltransferase
MWTTDRLRIEPLSAEHAPGLHAALDDPRVGEHIGGPDVTTVEALVERIARLRAGPPPGRGDERWMNYAVLLRHDATVIGRLEATAHDTWAEIAYVFGPSWWGAGLATEAVTSFVEHLGPIELWATVDPANERSQRLLERVGFTRVDEWRADLASYDPGDLVFVRRPDAARDRRRVAPTVTDVARSSGSASPSGRAG